MSFARNTGRVRIAANHYVGVLVAGLTVGFSSLAGCFTNSDGVAPPLEEFYYPTALLVSPGRTTLYVANSDFDLQYSGGTLQALDLFALRQKERTLRVALGEGAALDPPQSSTVTCAVGSLDLSPNDNTVLYPGPCSPVALAPFVRESIVIGAFASDATLALRPDPCKNGRGARLFVPVRGDPSVTYFDVTDDREVLCGPTDLAPSSPCTDPLGCLACGAETNGGRCATKHLVGKDPGVSQRRLTLEVDPNGIDVDERGEALVVAHSTQQSASLIVNDWNNIPALQYSTASLSPGPTDVAALPIPLLVEENRTQVDYTPAFVVSYRSSAEFTVLRYEDDIGLTTPPRPFLTRGLSASVTTTASAVDSRGITIDGTARRACEAKCGDVDREICLRSCVETHPLGVYMANRAPAALVIGRVETRFTEATGPNGEVMVTGAFEVPSFFDTEPLSFGASRVEFGHVIDSKGDFVPRIFVVTFDSRLVYSYDPEARRIDAIIRTGRGPHAIAFDYGFECDSDVKREDCTASEKTHAYATMYISHFTDSYVGVADLDMRNRTTFGSIYMTLGKPVPPKGSQ